MCPLWAECGPHSDVDSWEQTLSAEAKTLISTGKENTTKQTSKRLKKKQRDSKKSSPSTESPSSFPFPPFRFFVFFLLSHFCFFFISSRSTLSRSCGGAGRVRSWWSSMTLRVAGAERCNLCTRITLATTGRSWRCTMRCFGEFRNRIARRGMFPASTISFGSTSIAFPLGLSHDASELIS